jgi:hypothetical protein
MNNNNNIRAKTQNDTNTHETKIEKAYLYGGMEENRILKKTQTIFFIFHEQHIQDQTTHSSSSSVNKCVCVCVKCECAFFFSFFFMHQDQNGSSQ